ncbi:hypothetical protein DEJ03_00120 [Curtobacterium sp. MCLR17_043]|uniref:ATP-dependent nuclease n=1 Tax=Curtobacterium sp. MCLR17_043 TaxID=2175627 RepID=UPI000D9C217F|nr:AAA family ATPase [Curtobacterium sp. MCLR17_043]PYY48984.1 hypothetical protein DEJ03_00120 [Curtobacterium sp. MCLR17_043]
MRAKISVVNLSTPGEFIEPSDNVTLIVGPNNVGKSALLGNLHSHVTSEPHQPPNPGPQLVESANVSFPPVTEYIDSLLRTAQRFEPGTYPRGAFYEETFIFPSGTALTRASIEASLQRSNHFGQVANVFANYLGPEGRGSVLQPQQTPDLMGEPGRSPMQMLWADRRLEATMDSYMQRAFGRRLTVNRHAGLNTYLHVGSVSSEEPQLGTQGDYLDEVMALPLLSVQGSGMQAFMGTMLTLAAASFDIVLLDEPEAFLHPPQARLLGEVVAELSRDRGLQVIAATHSDDFVQGVLNASRDEAEVSVVRITRPVDYENRIAQVPPESLRSLYRDPLLRYSDILDGIFYKGAVLCESESDCTYYSATLAHLETTDDLSASDLLFTQCGGKDRFDRAYKALAAASVPTAVIADIDLLADRGKFAALFNTMGGDFSVIEASYNVIEASVRNQKVEPTRLGVREAMNEVLGSSEDPKLTAAELVRLRESVRSESGWKQVKRKGIGVVDSGGPTMAFESILASCRAIGLFLVAEGELERFHPEVTGNKQEWLRAVLEGELFKQAPSPQTFVREVRNFITSHQ